MVAPVLRQAIKYAKNNATKKVSGKDSRKTLNNAKKRGATSVTDKKPTATSVTDKKPTATSVTDKKPTATSVTDKKPTATSVTTPKGGDVSKNNVIKTLRKMGTKGKTIAAILAGGAGLLAGSTMMGDKKSLAPEGKTLGPMKPERRKGPSGPTMTSMSAPSTGPKPRNKDEKVDLKKRGPSRPSMTGFKHGGNVKDKGMGLNLADRKEFKKMAERDKPAVKRMLEEKPKRPLKRPPKGTIYSIDTLNKKVKRFKKGGNINGIAERGLTRAKHK
jgi:hypothetical protein